MDKIAETKYLKGEVIFLRPVEQSDLIDTYVNWLNDPMVNQWLETRWVNQTMLTIRDYWETHSKNSDEAWWAICTTADSRHVGCIKVGPVRWNHQSASVSLFIGDKGVWGKGVGSEAIKLVTDYCFSELEIEKLNAGVYANNTGSIKAFKKCEYSVQGCLKKDLSTVDGRVDLIVLGIWRGEWKGIDNQKL